jgi:hypothetical protein
MARFIGLDNMLAVLDSLGQRVRNSDDGVLRAIESGSAPMRQVVYDVMLDMAQDEAYAGIPIERMNQLAVDTAARFYEQLAYEMNTMRRTQQIAPAPRAPDALPEPSAPFQIVPSNEISAPGVTGPMYDGHPATTAIQCISIDGQDRDVRAYPDRYAFTYDLDSAIRTITSVVTATVVLPVVDQTINCPYLLLVVDQLPGVYSYNASTSVRGALTKLVPKSQWSSHGGREYTILEPCANDKRVYDPPIASLARLSIRLLRPNGQVVSAARDGMAVVDIAPGGPDALATYTLTMNRAVHRREFRPEDVVVISGCSTGNNAFDTYMNRAEGHIVMAAGAPNPPERDVANVDGVITIVVKRAGSLDDATGQEEATPGADSVFVGGNSLDLSEHPLGIINLSVQMSITMEAECSYSAVSSVP